jgi:hypothetical protein
MRDGKKTREINLIYPLTRRRSNRSKVREQEDKSKGEFGI